MYDSHTQKARYRDRDRSIDRYRYHNNDMICFGDVRSLDYGIYLTDIHIADSPKRDISFISIPGRNGDLVVDNKRWQNIDVTYSLAIATDFAGSFDAFKAALFSQDGYQKLTDSIYPDVFRMAIIKQPIRPETMRYNRTGRFDLTFHCKPQRYLKSGELAKTFTEPSKLHGNGFAAKPLITVYGSGAGTITVGDTTVEIKDMADQLILDCDIQNAYRQVGDGAPENMNSSIYAPEFPKLVGGENQISWTGGVTKVEIIPRWWKI